jgi:hypothetical protein
MRWGAVLAIAGVALGGTAGLLAAQSLKSMLYGVTTTDPRTLVGAVGVLDDVEAALEVLLETRVRPHLRPVAERRFPTRTSQAGGIDYEGATGLLSDELPTAPTQRP